MVEELNFYNSSLVLTSTRPGIEFQNNGPFSWTLTDDSVDNVLQLEPVIAMSPTGGSTLVSTGRNINATSPLTGGQTLASDVTLGLAGLTGLGSANQLVYSTGSAWGYLTLSGTTNEISLGFSGGTLTFSLPQAINTGASPTLAGVNITGTDGLIVGQGASITISTAIDILAASSSGPRLRYQGTGSGTGVWQLSQDGVTFSNILSGAGSGITSLNGLTAPTQTFSVPSGGGLTITSATANHAFAVDQSSAFTPTWLGLHTFQQSSLATALTDAIELLDPTASTSSVTVEESPALRFRGHGWNTASSGADNPLDFRMDLLPISANPATSELDFWFALNGGSYAKEMSLTSGGLLTVADGIGVTAGGLTITAGGITVNGGGFSLTSGIFTDSVSGADFELGSTSVANSPLLNFHSSGHNITYDTELIASGGTSSIGNGTLEFLGSIFEIGSGTLQVGSGSNNGVLKVAGTNGAGVTYSSVAELTAIPTTSGANVTTTIQIPANAIVDAVTVRVVSKPTGTSTFEVEGLSSSTQFSTSTSLSTNTGTTDPGTFSTPYNEGTSAQNIVYKFNATPTATGGQIRCEIFYHTISVLTS